MGVSYLAPTWQATRPLDVAQRLNCSVACETELIRLPVGVSGTFTYPAGRTVVRQRHSIEPPYRVAFPHSLPG